MLKDYIINKPIIEGKNIILRPMCKEDIEDLREWTPNKEIYKYWGKNPGKADLKPELLFEKPEKPSKSFHLGIYHMKDKKLIGDIYIYLIEKDKKAKIALRINPSYHHMGIGTEAVNTMVNWCFTNTELEIIWTDIDTENIASIRLFEKCQFRRVKELKQTKMVSVVCDNYVYEITK